MAITRGQLTVLGPESAVELLFQYSVSGSSNWHTVFAEGDLYFRVSSDGGVSWSEPARFAGPSGVSTYVHLAYANSADGSVGFSTSISTGKTYLGQWVSSSPTPSQEYDVYKWQKFVGEDGKGIVSATVGYQLHTSGTTPPTGTWLKDPPTPVQGRYSWTRTITTYTSGDPVTTYSVAYLATNGQNGADGKGITSTVIEYAQTLSGTTTPSSWSSTRPSPEKGQYLWTKTTISYSDSTNSVAYSISYSATDGQKGDKGDKGDPGIPGNPGADGQSQWTHLRYSVASNGNPMTPDPTAATKYIGIAVTNSGTAPTGYSSYTWQKFVGEDGDDGKGISSTVITYANHTNGTTAPTSGWQETPAPVKGRYLWTRTVTTYTDGSTIPTYSVAYQATDGQAGKGISSTVVEYAQTTSGTTTPTAWSGTRPAPVKGQYLWSKTTITYTDTTTSVSYSTSYSATDGQKGDQGDQGVPGTPGKDGQQYWTWIKYADSPTTGMNDLPAGKDYIGIAHNQTSPTESTDYADYTWSLIKGDKGERGATGERGPRGEDGTSVTGVVEHYLATPLATGVTKATSGWKTTMQPLTSTNRYLWNYETIQFSAGDPQDTIPVIIGVYGDTGRALTGITEYYLASASSTGVTRPATDGTNGWTTTPQVTTPDLPYLWNYEKLTWNAAPTTSYINPIVIAIHGQKGDKGDRGEKGATGDRGPIGPTGTSISSVVEYYLATSASSGVTTSTSGWKTTLQPMSATNKYLWNYEEINFSNGTSQPTIPVIIGVYGDKGETGATGRSITGITEHYLASSLATGVTRTTSGWNTAMQTTTPTNKYLWNYETITWSSGTTPTYTNPIIIGVHGDKGDKGDKGDAGRSITSVDVQYAKNSSTTSAPTTGWSTTAPGWENGKYIWSKTVTTYSTGNPTESTPVCITGQKGSTGGTGATGRGVSSIVEQFYLSTSKTTQVGGNWTTTMPTWKPGKYIWTRSLITYTSGTPPTSTTEPLVSSEWEAANDALEEAKDYTDEIDRKNETKSGNLLTNTFTGAGFEDLTVKGIVRLEALARAKGQGMINVYQVDGGKMKVYSVAVDSAGFAKVKTGDAVVVTPALGDIDGNVRVEVTGTVEFESLELYGYSIVPEWVTDWSGTATKVGENYVLSPYIFSGQVDINGLATGVSMGMDLTPGDPKPASSIYGYTSGELSYQLTGNTFEMIGSNGTSAGLSTADPRPWGVRFWAGAPHEDRDTAPFQVLEDGTLKATKAIIEGRITLTDPGASNIVTKETLGSFAYETANLLDEATNDFEAIQLKETIPYRLSSIRVGEGVYLKSGDEITFASRLKPPLVAGLKCGLAFVSETSDGAEVTDRVLGTITPSDTSLAEYTAMVTATIPPNVLYLYPFYAFGDIDNPMTWPENLGGKNLLENDSGELLEQYAFTKKYDFFEPLVNGEEYTLAIRLTPDWETTDIHLTIPATSQSAYPIDFSATGTQTATFILNFTASGISGGYIYPGDKQLQVDFRGGSAGSGLTYGTVEWVQIWKGSFTLSEMSIWEGHYVELPGLLASLEHKHQMVTRGEELKVWKPSFNSLANVLDDKALVMNYADGLFTQSVRSTEYLSDMDALYAVLDNKADVSRILDSDDVRAVVGVMQGEDYWGLVGVRSDIDRHNGAVNIVESSMTYKPRAEGSSAMELEFKTQGSENSLAINNEGIYFRSGTENVAWISQSTLHIASATIIDELRIGGHMFAKLKQDPRYTVIRAIT